MASSSGELGQDRRGVRVDVVDRELRLAARPVRPTSQDVVAQFGTGGSQARALADPDEQARDLGVAEHEGSPRGHLANARSKVGATTTAHLVRILAPRLPEPEGMAVAPSGGGAERGDG